MPLEVNGCRVGDKVSFIALHSKNHGRGDLFEGTIVNIEYTLGNIEFPILITVTIIDEGNRTLVLGPLSSAGFSAYCLRNKAAD